MQSDAERSSGVSKIEWEPGALANWIPVCLVQCPASRPKTLKALAKGPGEHPIRKPNVIHFLFLKDIYI